jgi:hypothetical protein
MRRMLFGAVAVVVFAAAGGIPIAVFTAPIPGATTVPREDGERIPWELSGAVWSECPMVFEVPEGLGIGWGIDGLGAWTMSVWDSDGNETPEDQVGVDFPELVEPLRIFHECLDRFPTTPYSEPLSLDAAQREMYWGYFVTELVPCLRDRGHEILLPSHAEFGTVDLSAWYLEEIGAWDGSVPLDDLVTVWNECPIYPSYLAPTSGHDVTMTFRPAV